MTGNKPMSSDSLKRYKASNYRPVSLTSITCKIMEHVLASQIMKHLERNKILFKLQFGFRSNRSCETQLPQLVQDLGSGIMGKHQTDMAIKDFSKAFNAVPHKRLISKLQYYGIHGKTQNWIKNFFKIDLKKS